MEQSQIAKLVDGYSRAFIDSSVKADPAFSPQFISNGHGQKVLTAIERELKSCDDMFISVAFITMGGIVPLLGVLKDLEAKGTKGKILTTDYLLFSDPKALDRINSLSNIELRLYRTSDSGVGFHTKGYMFHNDGSVRMIVGSSNLTQNAITTNHEWNTRLVSTKEGQYARDIEAEFNSLWESSFAYDTCKEEYENLYYQKEQTRVQVDSLVKTLNLQYYKPLEPNDMQKTFTVNVESLIINSQKRALLISATGTGKTYASAFAVRDIFAKQIIDKKKVLFLSHREQINKQALESYRRIFPASFKMGLLSGNENNVDIALSQDFLFSTMNMMAKDEIRSQFKTDHFSFIILDECHRSGAYSYQKIIDYFNPQFLLGMSASPDRPDGINVYEVFDHNIACEIRLQQALEDELLCPFHYFGITDLKVEDESIDAKEFKHLTSDARVKYIIDQAEYYGYSGDRVKGLIFCSENREAKELSEKFNQTGKYKTIALSGADSQEAREESKRRLESGIGEDRLDYIFTVDIFNEGIDIPSINQVIMLRPTQSPIIFVQQLGRGLRKSEGKEFVVVLDFIGNYDNNYMIPIALTGDRTGNKDNIRRGLIEGNNMIKGASTIYFDEVSKKRIFESIDSAKLNKAQVLKQDYLSLKNKLGRIPYLKDFDEYGELDPLRLVAYSGSYHNFLVKYEKEYTVRFSKKQDLMLQYISRHLAAGKRIHELLLLNIAINDPDNLGLWEEALMNENAECSSVAIESAINVLDNKFFRQEDNVPSFVKIANERVVGISEDLEKALEDKMFRIELQRVIDFGIYRYHRDYSKAYKNTSFVLNKKYTYQDVCWLANWKKEEVSLNIGGYKFDKHSKTYPVFINYQKEDDISDTTRYEDRFIDRTSLIAISKSNRSLSSEDVIVATNNEDFGVKLLLFIRKNKDDKESKEFYFLGEMSHPQNGALLEFIMPNTNSSAVEIEYELHTPIDSNLYDYLTD